MRKIFFAILVLTATFGFMPNQTFAQCKSFTAATHTYTGVLGLTPSSGYSGNDAKTSATLNPIEATVFDDPSYSGFTSKYNGSCYLKFVFPTTYGNYRFPDVAVMEKSGNWYAIVVYGIWNSTNYDAYYDIYKYTPTTCINTDWSTVSTHNPIPDPNSGNASFDNVIRIDAAADEFVIIWDNLSGYSASQGINAIAGTGITLSPYGSAVLILGSNNEFPDVSVYPTCNIYNTHKPQVYYVYDDANYPNLLNVGNVQFYDLYFYAGYSSNNPTYQTFTATGNYIYTGRPRIACPNLCSSTSCADLWTVVSEYYDYTGPAYDIVGYSSYNTSCIGGITISGPNVYTNGSMSNHPCLSPYTINGYDNTDPALSYDSGNNGIMIGWDSWFDDYTGTCSNCFNPTQSIAVICNIDGSYNTSYLCGANYLTLSTTNIANSARYLAISGRDYNAMQYSYCDFSYGADEAIKVDITFGSCSLRLGNSPVVNNDNVELSPNPFTSEVTLSFPTDYAQIKVYDMTGNLLLTARGNQEKINTGLNKFAVGIPKGVYMLKLETEDGSVFINKKFVKM